MAVYTDLNNSELLDLLKEDDQLAFAELYDRYWKHLYVIAKNRLSSSGVAEDLTHDIFEDLWSRRHSLKIEALEHYLSRAIKFSIFNYIRKESRMQQWDDSAFQSLEYSHNSTEEYLSFKEKVEKLETGISSLPRTCQLIFRYSRQDHYSNQEIADKLGVSKRTVENQISIALKRLRKLFYFLTVSLILIAVLH